MPPGPAQDERPPAFRISERAALILLLVVALTEAWALASTDPDYYLPDLFRPLSLGLIGLFFVTGWLRVRWLRRATRTLGFVTLLALLALEGNARFRGGQAARIEKTDDVLLRYRYRPGYEQADPGGGPPIRVNHLGLMDAEHAIPKPADVVRVAVLTGSIANDGAIPYEARFFRELERQLAGAAGAKRIEVINVSCEGYNTLQQERLLEQVGLLYEPDVVVVAYMLSAASLQNGGYRRFGDSFFLFRFLPLLERAETGSLCSLFAPFHERYTFDLIVRSSFERLALLAKARGFKALVAVLPVVERADDPICARLYDQVVRVAGETGLAAVRVPDAFVGLPVASFAKPNEPNDICHPNPSGHAKIGAVIAAAVRPLLAGGAIAPP